MVLDLTRVAEYADILIKITQVGEIIDFPQDGKGVFCLTLTLGKRKIYNIHLEYTSTNRPAIEQTITEIQAILKKFLRLTQSSRQEVITKNGFCKNLVDTKKNTKN